jgi:hypothetical protein
MIRNGSHGNTISWLVTMGVGSAALCAMTLTGFGSSVSGDTVVTATPAISTTLVLIGILALVLLQLSHVAGRRPARPARASASGEPVRA